ncbi:hypothetical protein DdX_09286 [Ditylenchus destructor]|uniref:Uncharacterized protein n=1 Tax=Ditylenchus destructor TaxID=166010 RepID=A0AAD4R6R6_9BILA|nr:hypothetical protein DdX_09286 [Ditylenchus destructor]
MRTALPPAIDATARKSRPAVAKTSSVELYVSTKRTGQNAASCPQIASVLTLAVRRTLSPITALSVSLAVSPVHISSHLGTRRTKDEI